MKHSEIMTKLQEIQTQQQSVLDANAAEISKYLSMMEQSKQLIEDATTQSTEAYKAADIKGYHKSLDEKRSNEDAVHMYEAKIDELKKVPLLSEDEYKGILNSITAEMDVYIEDRTQEYAALLEKMLKMRSEISSTIMTADTLIQMVQKKLFRDPCGIYNSSGTFVPVKTKEKKYQNRSLLEGLYDTCRTPFNYDLLSKSFSAEEVTGIPQIRKWGTAIE